MTLDKINYEEPYGSFNISFGKDDTTATRMFKIDWDDLADFLIELKGGYRNVPSFPWTPPARLPGFEFLYCTEADVEGLGKAHEHNGAEGHYTAYEYAKVSARYEAQKVVDNEIDDPTAILEETLRLSAEFLVLPEGSYLWESDDVAMNEAPGKLMPSFEYNITRPSVQDSGASTLLTLIGHVNEFEWRGLTAGQALFLGSDADRTTTTDGAENWKITYSFLLRGIPHNYFFRPKSAAGWELVIEDNGGADTYVYDEGDFADLNLDQGTLL